MTNKISIFIALCALIIFGIYSSSNSDDYASITALQAAKMVEQEQAIIIDVREDNEWQSGHIPEAIHLPLGQVQSRLAELEIYKGRPIIMQCHSGVRSAKASSILVNAGFDQVSNMSGGILAWNKAGLEVK